MRDCSHLDAILFRLSNERARLANAKTAREISFREIQVSQAEKELVSEMDLLGGKIVDNDMSDDELLAALSPS